MDHDDPEGRAAATAVVLAVCMTGGIRMFEAQGSLPGAPGKKQLTVQEIKKLRKKSAHRKRRIIFHSDGKPIDAGMGFRTKPRLR